MTQEDAPKTESEAAAEPQSPAGPQAQDQTQPQAPAGSQDQTETLAQGEAQEPGEAEEKDNLPPVAVAVEEAGTLKKKVTVTVPRARIDAKFEEMFGELSHSALVPGFRVGHAPRKLIEKRFGKDVSQDVRNAVIGESLGQAMKDGALAKTLGEPSVDLEKIEIPDQGDLAYSFEVEVAPEFTLPALAGILVTRPRLSSSQADADAYIEQLRRSRAKHEATEEAAVEGDVVTAGARISGEGIDPLEKPGLTLRVAPGQIEGLPLIDLGEALAGKKAGESATLTLTVPDAHPNEAWRGKKVQVAVAVSQVRRTVLPEFNQAFCDELGFASPEQLRQFVARRLQQEVARRTQQAMYDQVVEYLLKSTQFEVPEGVAARHAREFLERKYLELLRAGVPREKIDENLTRLQERAVAEAVVGLKVSFILGKVAEEQKLQVEPGEVNARVAEMAARNERRPERLRQELEQQGSLESLEASLLEEKVLQSLLAQAQITDAPEEAPQGEAPSAPEAPAPGKAETPVAEEKKTPPAKEPEPAAQAAPKAAKPKPAEPAEEEDNEPKARRPAHKPPAHKAPKAEEEKPKARPKTHEKEEGKKPSGHARKPSSHKKEKD